MSKQFLVLLLVCLTLLMAGWPAQTSFGADKETAGQALADGRAALDRGDSKQALDKCEEALRLFEQLHDKAGMAQGLYYLGKAHYQLNHSNKAQDYLERARTL